MASAFEAAAALISIVGKSCGLQDLRPIVNVEGGSSSVVLPPLRHPNAEATDEERPRLGDESQRSMCCNPRLLMRSFLRREREREEGEKRRGRTFSIRHSWGSCIGICDDSLRTAKHPCLGKEIFKNYFMSSERCCAGIDDHL